MDLPVGAVPEPDPGAHPDGFVVTVDGGDRIHFLDWGGPPVASGHGVLLVHGLAQTAWTWTPVARRVVASRRVIAMDLRGHGLSDAPTEDGAYELDRLAADVVAVAEGSGLTDGADGRLLLAGHGFGAIVAATAAVRLGSGCAGLVLVDGGWESVEASSGLDVESFLRGSDEPPEVLASMAAFLADRAGFDPSTWSADQEAAARATVIETHAGRVVSTTRPHVREACVRAMFAYRPEATLAAVEAPIIALAAASSGDDDPGARGRAHASVDAARRAVGRDPIRLLAFPRDGHNLMRYRPDAVSAAILGVDGETG